MIVIAGVPAIGKTTLIERAIPEGVVVLCPDLIRSELQAQAGVEDFDESFWGATFDLLHERVDAELASEHTVVVHVTGLNRHQQQDLTRLTRANDREAHIIFLDATRELCAAGLSGRVVKIPNARMEKYHEQWDDLKSRLLTRSEDVLEGEILDLNDGRSRRKFALLGSGESMMRARGFNSVTIINREAVNNLQRIHFV
jgi:predicted kinase